MSKRCKIPWTFWGCNDNELFRETVQPEITMVEIEYIDRGVGDYLEFANIILHRFPNIERLSWCQKISCDNLDGFISMIYKLKLKRLYVMDSSSDAFNLYETQNGDKPCQDLVINKLYNLFIASFKTGCVLTLMHGYETHYRDMFTKGGPDDDSIYPTKLKDQFAITHPELKIVHYEKYRGYTYELHSTVSIRIKHQYVLEKIFGKDLSGEIIKYIPNRCNGILFMADYLAVEPGYRGWDRLV